jgi:hypothetical protein
MTLVISELEVPAAGPEVGPLAPAVRARFVTLLCFVLLGYALSGRGFAYVGVPPLFIGEISLLLGMAALAQARDWQGLLAERTVWPLLGLFAWGAIQTVRYLPQYGIDCLRDAVCWGYGIFAIVIAALILDNSAVLGLLVRFYRRFVKLFLAGIPIVFVAYHLAASSMPRWPWADVKVLQVKEGDAMVHLAGITAFWVSGLCGDMGWGWILLLTIDTVTLGVIDRAGMVSFVAVFAACLIFRPRHEAIIRVIATLAVAAAALWATDLHVPIPDSKGRDVSFHQVVTNLGSVASDTGSDGLDSTKEWRLDWWHAIVGYTFHGKYFWTGKGFGVNLADDDGFQLLADHSLRNPHSIHMTMLARGGVPMLMFWAGAVLGWFWLMATAMLAARRDHQPFWEGLFFFLATYLMAFVINGSFDVFIEGPMGGIWLWTIYGTGLGAAIIRRRELEVAAQ